MALWRGGVLDPTRPPGSAGRPAGWLARARRQLAVPFIRNAYSLVGSHLATAGFGLVFWFVAAQAYSSANLGRNSALISTMLVLSSVAQLNLVNGFNRFVPTAGAATRRLVLVGYAAATATAAVLAAVFVLGVELWAPDLSRVRSQWPYGLAFVAGTVAWTVFALQDAVLAGLGEARWVLAKSLTYGITKLALLFVAAALMPAFGVFAAWIAPLAVLVVAVDLLIFRRFLPARDHPPLEEIDAAIVRRYVGFDMVGSIMLNATIGLLPVLALVIVGPSASAYFFLSWMIAYTLYMVSFGVAMSFVTEASRAPDHIIELARTMIVHALRIVAPLALVVALGAPLILRVLRPEYADNATLLLQLLALSAIPNVVVTAYLSMVRVHRRMRAVIGTTAALVSGVIVLSVTLMPSMGVTGAGVAWLVSQSVVAAVLLLGELRPLWRGGEA